MDKLCFPILILKDITELEEEPASLTSLTPPPLPPFCLLCVVGGLEAKLVLFLGGVVDTIVHPKVPSFFFVHFLTLTVGFLLQVVIVLVLEPKLLLSICRTAASVLSGGFLA